MRRIVTGHTKDGRSVFVGDGEPPRVVTLDHYPGFEMIEVWATDIIPIIPPDESDLTVGMSSLVPGTGGTRFRIVQLPPDPDIQQAIEAGIDVSAMIEAARQELLSKAPGLGEAQDTEDPGMHTTDTVDYDVILSGEIWLELDDGAEVHLKQGDCIVQNGTRHAWRNRGTMPCVMASVMIGARQN